MSFYYITTIIFLLYYYYLSYPYIDTIFYSSVYSISDSGFVDFHIFYIFRFFFEF